jgi:hypothetical protein
MPARYECGEVQYSLGPPHQPSPRHWAGCPGRPASYWSVFGINVPPSASRSHPATWALSRFTPPCIRNGLSRPRGSPAFGFNRAGSAATGVKGWMRRQHLWWMHRSTPTAVLVSVAAHSRVLSPACDCAAWPLSLASALPAVASTASGRAADSQASRTSPG